MPHPLHPALISYAKRVRTTLLAKPTNVEQALAPAFKQLVDEAFPLVLPSASGLATVPEYATPAVGRPDIAIVRAGQLPRAFIELKAPDKSVDPDSWRNPHDKRQFKRFQALPTWALTNFIGIRLYRRDAPVNETVVVPALALKPSTKDAAAAALITEHDPSEFSNILMSLASASPPISANARDVAENLAYAARLVREIAADRIAELTTAGASGEPLQLVRDEFREVLYAHPKAAGYPDADFDILFAAAFAQTLAFGLLLVREATSTPVGPTSWAAMPDDHRLLKATLRALSEPEIVHDIGAGFDIMLDTVNTTDPALLAPSSVGHDPILYFYEDFLAIFDPVAREKHGVFYTPVEVVRFQVSALERVLRTNFGLDGLSDSAVTVLDPAVGTGTYLIACVERVALRAVQGGAGLVAPALADLSHRLFAFELLVGPYAVAHYRLNHALRGSSSAAGRANIYLADTLAEPGATAPAGRLGFVSAPIADERAAADRLKQEQPILAIIGNPPYRRLREGETAELVGRWMDGIWDDLKEPVRNAGWGGELNTFPDLYIAFWRWALWKLFDAPGATGRGVVAYITNRTFLAGHPYAGLRQMLRQRFDRIEVYDLRGDIRLGSRAGVVGDEGVFSILAGTAITLAWSTGEKEEGTLADVVVHDSWAAGAFSRDQKLQWLTTGTEAGALPGGISITRDALDDMKPRPFEGRNWPGLDELFLAHPLGVQSKRDPFVYAFSAEQLRDRINEFRASAPANLVADFNATTMNTIESARAQPFEEAKIVRSGYRPLDVRYHYAHVKFNDRIRPDLQGMWGTANLCLYAMPKGTGQGPATWCHALIPDYHAFRGSYGGYAFPLRDNRPLSLSSNISPTVLTSLSAIYGAPVVAEDLFDAILALLSAEAYSSLFAEDLEGAFPHVPLPRSADTFSSLVALGREIRALETFGRNASAGFSNATVPEGPMEGAMLGTATWEDGVISLGHGAGRVAGVPEQVWEFGVSGYKILQRWLEHRSGSVVVDFGLLNQIRDLVARIAELMSLYAQGNSLLEASVANPLRKNEIGLT